MVSLTASSARLNQTRFDELFTEHQSTVRRYVCSLNVDPSAIDDIMQDTAIALWRKFDAYDSTRPFAPWACRFAFLQVLKHRQRTMRDRLVLDADDRIEKTPADWDKDSDACRAQREALQKSLTLLDESDRQLLCCRYESRETIQSMAKRQATSVHKLYHALDSIRDSLKISINRLLIEEGFEHATTRCRHSSHSE